MAYKKITADDLRNKGVIGLADTPGLSTQRMQEKFEETSRSVIIPHFNQLIDTLTENGVPVKSEDIIKIKKDENGDLLISADGINWIHSSGSALEKKADKAETYTKYETDNKLLSKADNVNVYSKKEIDKKLLSKADNDNVYNKTETYTKKETDGKLLLKADNDSVYNKNATYNRSEVDKALQTKSDKANTYTKDEVYTKRETEKAISDRISDIGSADMTKAVYDKDSDGVIDNAWSLSGGIKIARGTDLNTIIKEGNYYNHLNEEIPSLKNCPVDRNFSLKVSLTNGVYDGAITQELNAHNGEMSYFRKGHISSGIWTFTGWRQLASTKDLEVQNVTQKGTDLNNYKTTGKYYFSQNYTPLNAPEGVNGWLIVMSSADNSVKQVWYRYGTRNENDVETYVRTLAGSTWSEWVRYANEKDIENTWSLSGGVALEKTTDLNTITKFGNYYSISFGSTLPNAPVSSAFIMKVYGRTGNSAYNIMQEVLSYMPSLKGLEYKREGTYNTELKKWNFSEWVQTANTKDVNAIKTIANAAMPKSGGTFTGKVGINDNLMFSGRWLRNIVVTDRDGVNQETGWITLVRK